MDMIKNRSDLSDLLNLRYSSEVQDWRIVNADDEKVGLFLYVYKSNNLSQDLQLDLIELILNSLNSKLSDQVDENGFIFDKDSEEYWRVFLGILNQKRRDVQFMIDDVLQWRGYAPEEEIKECLPILLLFEKEFGGTTEGNNGHHVS